MTIRTFLTTVTFLTLSACGGGSSSDSAPSEVDLNTNTEETTDPSYTINAFTITGTDGDFAPPPVTIDPAMNSGNFVMTLDVEDHTQTHYLDAFVSLNDVLSESDTAFWSELCTELSCGKTNPFSKDCFFNNSNELYCAGDEDNTTDMTAFLDTLPKDAYIILRMCETPLTNCDTASVQVQFR